MNKSTPPAGPSGTALQLACLDIVGLEEQMWKTFVSYLQSKLIPVKSPTSKSGRPIKVTSYTSIKDIPTGENIDLILLCGFGSSSRIEPRSWREALLTLPATLRESGRHLNVALCLGTTTIRSEDGQGRLPLVTFGIERSVHYTRREIDSLEQIREVLAEQLAD